MTPACTPVEHGPPAPPLCTIGVAFVMNGVYLDPQIMRANLAEAKTKLEKTP